MMNTREQILTIADDMIRLRGYNAFSFHDIAHQVGIKTSSVHYHFPTKTDLGLAVIRDHSEKMAAMKEGLSGRDALKQLKVFFSIYTHAHQENKVCLVASLTTDLNTVDEALREALKGFATEVLGWLTGILEKGKEDGIFHFEALARTKALSMVAAILAAVKLSRLTGPEDFFLVHDHLIEEITCKKI